MRGLEKANQYNKEIKEFLLFDVLFMDVVLRGPRQFTDSLANQLIEQHRMSYKYQKIFSDKKKEFADLMPGNIAPPLQGISPEGKVCSLNDFKGKVIFVDIWATWCSPCIKALPHMSELQEKLGNNKNLIFLFLSNDQDEKKWKNYLLEHPEFKGVHLRARKEEDRPFENAWKGGGIPRYMLIDQEGKIIDAFAKNNSYKKLQEIIEKVLLK